METRVNRSPSRIVRGMVILLAIVGGLIASTFIAPNQSELPPWLAYIVAACCALLAVVPLMELFRLKTPVAILSPAGLIAPNYSATVVPWEKVRQVEREYGEGREAI